MSTTRDDVLAQLNALDSDRREAAIAYLRCLELPGGGYRLVTRAELRAALARVGAATTAPELAGDGTDYAVTGAGDVTGFDGPVQVDAIAELAVLWTLMNHQHFVQNSR